jgi:hypothetical protein
VFVQLQEKCEGDDIWGSTDRVYYLPLRHAICFSQKTFPCVKIWTQLLGIFCYIFDENGLAMRCDPLYIPVETVDWLILDVPYMAVGCQEYLSAKTAVCRGMQECFAVVESTGDRLSTSEICQLAIHSLT